MIGYNKLYSYMFYSEQRKAISQYLTLCKIVFVLNILFLFEKKKKKVYYRIQKIKKLKLIEKVFLIIYLYYYFLYSMFTLPIISTKIAAL